MLRLAVDQDFNHKILRALQRECPELDLVILREVELDRVPDDQVLEWSAEQGRVLLSHDVTTLRACAEQRVHRGLPMPGVIFTPQQPDDMGALVADILLVAQAATPRDWEEIPCRFLPL